jgi:hypothetical protein
VEEFVAGVVTARSRVVHGTRSTVDGHDTEVSRRDVARLAQNFILTVVQKIAAYETAVPNPNDDLHSLVDRRPASEEVRSGGCNPHVRIDPPGSSENWIWYSQVVQSTDSGDEPLG